MKLILCTLLGFAVVIGILAVVVAGCYGVGSLVYWACERDWPWRYASEPVSEITTAGLFVIIISTAVLGLSYLIGKGICQ